jgi:methionyl-tRNA synthetase
VAVAEYVSKNSAIFKKLADDLEISLDYFIATSSDRKHLLGAQKLWRACRKEDIYKKKYAGMYCVGCEEFKTEKDLVNGECPEHPGKKLEIVEEENYFFKLSDYQDKLLKIIESGEMKIVPEIRKNETLAFIKSGLQDFSISRSKERCKNWGIPVPEDDSQMMYVWFDALSNYINALDYATESENYKKFWQGDGQKVHCIGKGINRFHTIYWPAMLLSAGLPLPTTVFIHGYVTINGQKMSKTIGNVIDPEDLIKEYGVEPVRYYLARHISSFEDSDFRMENLKEAYNAHLANGIGNLTSRVMKMAENNLDGPVVVSEKTIPQEFFDLLGNFQIDKACDFIWEKIGEMDKFIQENQPFKVVKTEKEKGQKMITELVVRLYFVARMLNPIMPETSGKIKKLVKENKSPEEPLFLRKE